MPQDTRMTLCLLDQLELDLNDLGINRVRFKVVNSKGDQKKHSSRSSNLIYNERSNKLFVDLNGKESGFGSGGLLAKFDDGTELNKNSITDLTENVGGNAGPGGSTF